jgi:excisionase family DNA binding protein
MAQSKQSPDDLLSTREAGIELGVTLSRVQVLIYEGRLPAKKVGQNWIIRRGDLELVRIRKPGRPRGKGNASTPRDGKKKL